MKNFIRIVEQADADNMYADAPKKAHTFGKPDGQEFGDRGRADINSKASYPRADNGMEATDKLDEFMGGYPGAGITPEPDQLDQLHTALTRAGMSDLEIRQGVTLTDNGKHKLAGALGVSIEDVELLISSLVQKLRDEDNSTTDALIDDYYSTLGEGKNVPMDIRALNEKAPPGKKAERFIKDNKADFKERYGDEWKQALYATAWKMFGKKHKKNESIKTPVVKKKN